MTQSITVHFLRPELPPHWLYRGVAMLTQASVVRPWGNSCEFLEFSKFPAKQPDITSFKGSMLANSEILCEGHFHPVLCTPGPLKWGAVGQRECEGA